MIRKHLAQNIVVLREYIPTGTEHKFKFSIFVIYSTAVIIVDYDFLTVHWK